MQNKYIYKKTTNKQRQQKEKKREEQTEHSRIAQLLHHGQPYNLHRKKRKTVARKKEGKTLRLLTVPTKHKHIIK